MCSRLYGFWQVTRFVVPVSECLLDKHLTMEQILVGSLSRTRRLQDLSPWDIHTRGLYNILKARGTSRLQTEKDRAAFWPSYNMVVSIYLKFHI
jgi:hypothetical protein